MGTASPPTKIMDFRGFYSSIILILRGGIPRPIVDFPESLSQAILVGMMLGRLGVFPKRSQYASWLLPRVAFSSLVVLQGKARKVSNYRQSKNAKPTQREPNLDFKDCVDIYSAPYYQVFGFGIRQMESVLELWNDAGVCQTNIMSIVSLSPTLIPKLHGSKSWMRVFRAGVEFHEERYPTSFSIQHVTNRQPETQLLNMASKYVRVLCGAYFHCYLQHLTLVRTTIA